MTLKAIPMNPELRGNVMCQKEHGPGSDRPTLNAKSVIMLPAIGSGQTDVRQFSYL